MRAEIFNFTSYNIFLALERLIIPYKIFLQWQLILPHEIKMLNCTSWGIYADISNFNSWDSYGITPHDITFCAATSYYTSWDTRAWTSNCSLRDTCAEISNYIYCNICGGAYNYVSWATCEVTLNIPYGIIV